jgi:glycosyltransferase involved in cell wall biosynthesis
MPSSSGFDKNDTRSLPEGRPESDSRHRRHPSLSVVLPAYNEADGLSAAVRCYLDALNDLDDQNFEILVVNDGSTDGTGELAEELAREDSRVRVLHHEHNRGLSASFLRGFGKAKGEIVTWNGVDLPFNPNDTRRALACFEDGADVAVVERRNRKAYGITRKVISRANVLLLRFLFGTPFRDYNFVQFYRRHVLESIKVETTAVSTMSAEMIIKAVRGGYRVVSLPAEYHQRQTGKSTVRPGHVLHAFLETLRLKRLVDAQSGVSSQRPRGF